MEYQKCGTIVAAAMKANMSPQTASKYIKSGGLPPFYEGQKYPTGLGNGEKIRAIRNQFMLAG